MKEGATLKLVAVCLLVCAWLSLATRATHSQAGTRLGDPLPGLTTEQLALFREGKTVFEKEFKADEGLGPTFNGISCAACHFTSIRTPVSGGPSSASVTRFARIKDDGSFDPLPGGSLLQLMAIEPECREVVPSDANVMIKRTTTSAFGAGLMEAIPDETILASADPDEADRDGVSGRAQIVVDPATGRERVGRFGWKAQQATLLGFSADAFQGEMGITNDLFPAEQLPNGDATRLARCDRVPDVEDKVDPATGRRGIDKLANFQRLLGAPPRGVITAEVMQGEDVFKAIGCAACHVPQLMTGASDVAALNLKSVPLYSDLLLHDIGTGDGIVQGRASGREFRTPPLWGLRSRQLFHHDGRGITIEQAISQHAGEAAQSKTKFDQLSAAERLKLLAFLSSL
jgi:CxxC motif-containing protein (DUF1111 family)